MTKTVYRGTDSKTKEIWLEIIENKFVMVVRKIGDRCESISGRDDREREVNIRMDEMERCLGVKGGNAVVNALLTEKQRIDGIDTLISFLDKRMVSYNYFSF